MAILLSLSKIEYDKVISHMKDTVRKYDMTFSQRLINKGKIKIPVHDTIISIKQKLTNTNVRPSSIHLYSPIPLTKDEKKLAEDELIRLSFLDEEDIYKEDSLYQIVWHCDFKQWLFFNPEEEL